EIHNSPSDSPLPFTQFESRLQNFRCLRLIGLRSSVDQVGGKVSSRGKVRLQHDRHADLQPHGGGIWNQDIRREDGQTANAFRPLTGTTGDENYNYKTECRSKMKAQEILYRGLGFSASSC